jgi:hypothetical protein
VTSATPPFASALKVSRRAAETLEAWIAESRGELPTLLAGAASWPLEARIVLLLVAAEKGAKLPREVVREVLELAPEDAYLPMLVAAADGDRIEMLLDVVEARRVTLEREVFLLVVLSELLDGVGPPAFQRALRLACRQDLYEEEKGLALLAAKRAGDADTKKLASRVTAKPGRESERIAKEIKRDLEKLSLDRLPEDEVSTEWPQTVRRAVPKVGRNDPCPCGSGKKYKKCCQDKDAERAGDPSPVPGVTMAEYRTTSSHLMPLEEFAHLRVEEMLQADRAKLSPEHLHRAIRRAIAFRRFDAAALFADELGKRKSLPKALNADEQRLDIASAALTAGDVAAAEELIAALKDPKRLDDSIRFPLALLKKDPGAYELADRLAEDGLRGGRGGIAVAYSFLDHLPALGILVARGCLDPSRVKESDTLADEIGRARDRLLVSPFDPAVAVYDDVVERRRGEDDLEKELEQVATEKKALAQETQELKRSIRDEAARAAELEHQIRRMARQEEESRPAAGAPALPDEERRRLAGKLDELKGLLAASNQERAELRRRVTELAEQAPRAAKPAEPAPGAAPEEDEESTPVDVPEGRGVRIPRLSRNVEDALRAQSAAVAKDALQTITDLSIGIFRGVKRLVKAKDPLYSARVGIHFRLLFRPSEGRLEVLELVHRQELEAVIKRYL